MEGEVGKLGCRYMAGGLEESEMDHTVSETTGGRRISWGQVMPGAAKQLNSAPRARVNVFVAADKVEFLTCGRTHFPGMLSPGENWVSPTYMRMFGREKLMALINCSWWPGMIRVGKNPVQQMRRSGDTTTCVHFPFKLPRTGYRLGRVRWRTSPPSANKTYFVNAAWDCTHLDI